MVANAMLGRDCVGIVAVVQDVLWDVAEDRLDRVIVRARLGHAGPVQPQLPHHPPRRLRLDRMRRIAVQGDPHRLPRIPLTHPPQETTDILRPLARVEGPVNATMVDLVEQEQVEPPPGLLVPPQHQALGPGVTAAAIRLDRDRLYIEEGQDGPAWAVVPPRPQSVQDQTPIGIGAEELALDAAQCVPPFFSTRRRCSRLIAGTMRSRMRYARNLAKLQRPNGSPRVVGSRSARRQMAAICCFDKRGGAPSLRGRLSADRPCRANSRRSV